MLIKASRYVAKLRRTKTFIFNLAIFSWPELLSPWKLIFSIKIGWFFSLHKFSDFSPTFIWLSTPARLDWQFVKKNIVRFIFLDVTKKLVCTTFSLVSYAQQGRSWPCMENCVNNISLRLTPARVAAVSDMKRAGKFTLTTLLQPQLFIASNNSRYATHALYPSLNRYRRCCETAQIHVPSVPLS